MGRLVVVRRHSRRGMLAEVPGALYSLAKLKGLLVKERLRHRNRVESCMVLHNQYGLCEYRKGNSPQLEVILCGNAMRGCVHEKTDLGSSKNSILKTTSSSQTSCL